MRYLFHAAIFVCLTVLTQLGGLAWLAAQLFRWRLAAFLLIYGAMTLAAQWSTPLSGRVPLSCRTGANLQVQSLFYCAANRNFVSVELNEVLEDAAEVVDEMYPGTKTLVLDANFPFLTGFPLLPHLSHDDGDKVDLALFYRDQSGYLVGKTRSPIGYFAFEAGETGCAGRWPTLRWDLLALQGFWPDYAVEPARTVFLLETLARDRRVGKMFVEPSLQKSLGVADAKIRFQGCRAARHDDHIHLQL